MAHEFSFFCIQKMQFLCSLMGAHSNNGKKRTTISVDEAVFAAGEGRAEKLYKGNFSNYVEALIEMDTHTRKDHVIVRSEHSTSVTAKESPGKKPPSKRSLLKEFRARRVDVAEVSLSIFGGIPAGWPEERIAVKAKREVKVAKNRFPEGAFGLDVSGDSMNAATGRYGPVLDGETVVLLAPDRREPKHGDIVAALCDGRTTLKRLWCKPKPCVLRAESDSPEWQNCIRPAHDLVIQGVVIGKL